MAVGKESYFWHKLHSLSGVIPVGFYMLQHLTLNTFSLGGREKFNGVIAFFEGIPYHILLFLEIFVILLPLLFHGIYGLFIVARADGNYSKPAYKFRENRYYTMQRWSGIVAFFLLIIHVMTTAIAKRYVAEGHDLIKYDGWAAKLSANGYIWLIFYMLLVITCSYHLAYGIWNFCIRWGITISEKAQMSMGKFAAGAFIGITVMGWAALLGFLWAPFAPSDKGATITAERPAVVQPVIR